LEFKRKVNKALLCKIVKKSLVDSGRATAVLSPMTVALCTTTHVRRPVTATNEETLRFDDGIDERTRVRRGLIHFIVTHKLIGDDFRRSGYMYSKLT
jgi:hypothetical protein